MDKQIEKKNQELRKGTGINSKNIIRDYASETKAQCKDHCFEPVKESEGISYWKVFHDRYKGVKCQAVIGQF